MDIFVRHIPSHCAKKQIEKQFSAPLAECGINIYHVEKIRDKPMAVITVLDTIAGEHFLRLYGVPQGVPGHVRAKRPLRWDGRFLQCTHSRNEPNELSLKSLVYEASQEATKPVTKSTATTKQPNTETTRFSVSGLQCGVWSYAGPQLVFNPHYVHVGSGNLNFGLNEAIVLIGPPESNQIRLDIRYFDCDSIVLGSNKDLTITFTLAGMPPKFYEVAGLDVLSAQLTAMTLGFNAAKAKTVKKNRLPHINNDHGRVAGSCFVYRLSLLDVGDIHKIKNLLSRNAKMPALLSMYAPTRYPEEIFGRSKERLDIELRDAYRFGARPFPLRFQLDRLARNGRLPPFRVLELLPMVAQLHDSYGLDATLKALRRFYNEVLSPGPETESFQVSKASMEQELEDCAASYDPDLPYNPYELSKRHTHINLIHKVVITPAGTYLEGPEPEPTNRVLRKYPGQTDCFLRVVFQDEDGGSVRYDPKSDQTLIYHQRFKQVLDGAILIAGKSFTFLGFSHSSLRSQSCWFMAPVFLEHELVFAPRVIRELGNFETIRTPAKCAARIGQCFTDTATSVQLTPSQVSDLPVVERNGRDFSDGVGTISEELLRDVWRVYGTKRALKPTILQIRFQGAKGVVSLDPMLRGRQLNLRSNMRKFETADSWDLEICGAAFRPLPMVLNRQFIKILEDLGIRAQAFLDLQTAAVNDLRCMTTSAVNTSSLLETLEGTKSTRIPSLIMLLDEIGIDYRSDVFLYKVVEMAVISKLRDIKYRGRIPVDQGVTLYGIMDETGYLNEGEVYVATESGPEGGRIDIARERIIVTRSPAMHPGDVQVVNAVSVPADSPLKKLSNVVVFSQHGARDLPSQLSGGDLDGDLYNVIWDRRLVPSQTFQAADYPRIPPVELDRPVRSKDLSDFFVTFMETDQLGMLCNVHMQLADQLAGGTFSQPCLKLAGMASTAVDYSKTGIPVNMKDLPRYKRFRPDFMAPSPRVIISDQGYIDIEDEDLQDDIALDGLDPEPHGYRYYQSTNVLGALYRNIDERQFLASMQRHHHPAPSRLLTRLVTYMHRYIHQYGLMYTHHLPLARDIRASYDDSLLDLMHFYSPSVHHPLSEHEVFAGQILGRQGGAQGKPLREMSKTLRERFEMVVAYTAARIEKGDQAIREVGDLEELDEYRDREFEALPRAIACLMVAEQEGGGGRERQVGELRGFGYVAAGACLRELQRFRITTFGYRTLPRV